MRNFCIIFLLIAVSTGTAHIHKLLGRKLSGMHGWHGGYNGFEQHGHVQQHYGGGQYYGAHQKPVGYNGAANNANSQVVYIQNGQQQSQHIPAEMYPASTAHYGQNGQHYPAAVHPAKGLQYGQNNVNAQAGSAAVATATSWSHAGGYNGNAGAQSGASAWSNSHSNGGFNGY